MSEREELVRDAEDLVRASRAFVREPDGDPAGIADFCRQLERFSHQLAAKGRLYLESAAWCRLASGLLRGDDVPESIHAPDGEDPADAARWRKWRV